MSQVNRSEESLPAMSEAGAEEQSKRSWWQRLGRPILGLLIAVLISAFVLAIGGQIENFAQYGYPGILLLNMLSSATIIIPAPGLAVVPVLGSVLNPYLVGLFAGTGDALGEMSGYLAGYSGRAIIENRARYEQMVEYTRRYGLLVILILSIIPNPLFDLAGIAAGALKIPVGRFLVVCWVGKTIKTTVFALSGQAIIRMFPFLVR